MTNLTTPQDFIFAGNATFTLLNTTTEKRFTYKLEQAKESRDANKPAPHFLSVLTGSNNEEDYMYLGMVWDASRFWFDNRKSKVGGSAQSVKVIKWALPHILADSLPESVEVHHEGTCGRCGRKLTDPQSIELGIGPHCRKEMGL